jgi:hypothetical protein
MTFNLVEKRKTFYLRMILMILIFPAGFRGLVLYNIAVFFIPLLLLIPLFISPNFFYSQIGFVTITDKQVTIGPDKEENFSFMLNGNYNLIFTYASRGSNKSLSKYSLRGAAID